MACLPSSSYLSSTATATATATTTTTTCSITCPSLFLSNRSSTRWYSSSSTSSYPVSRVSFSIHTSTHRGRGRGRDRIGEFRWKAAGDGSSSSSSSSSLINEEQERVVYQGAFGPWSLDDSDVREVILYRCGLVTAATSFVLASSPAFLPDDFPLTPILYQSIDILYALGAAGLGVSLVLIHIYVTEIKRTLQALWVAGVLGSLATQLLLAQPSGQGLVPYVLHNPTSVWFVGPLFAALTGLVFKEGLCYGKLEAAILTFIIPSLLLGHLSGLMDDGVKVTLLGLWMALFVIFAGRKFTQPIKDDVGDKSVFMFKALPEEEKAALVQKLEQQKLSGL